MRAFIEIGVCKRKKKQEKRNLYLESFQTLYLTVICTVELVQSDT